MIYVYEPDAFIREDIEMWLFSRCHAQMRHRG